MSITPRQDLIIQAGETWGYVFKVVRGGVPVDITGYSAVMTVRDDMSSDVTTALSASPSVGGLVVDGPAGTVTASMSARTTSLLLDELFPWWNVGVASIDYTNTTIMLSQSSNHYQRRYSSPHDVVYRKVYDVEVTSPMGSVMRIAQGRLMLYPGVTTGLI